MNKKTKDHCVHIAKTDSQFVCKDCGRIINLMDYVTEVYHKAFKAGQLFEKNRKY